MRLIPFNTDCDLKKIQEWTFDPDYARVWRGINRHLTAEECKRLPLILECEILLIEEEPRIMVGLVEFKDEPLLSKFSILIDKSRWRYGYGAESLRLLEDYAFHRKMVKALLTECSTQDLASNKELSRTYQLIGQIPDYCFFNGKLEDVNIYHKRSPSWDS